MQRRLNLCKVPLALRGQAWATALLGTKSYCREYQAIEWPQVLTLSEGS